MARGNCDIMVRLVMLFAGMVAVTVGVVGLLVPVNVGEENVGCGSALFPDFSAAREATNFGGANIPVLDQVIATPDYVELCDTEVADRRVWTITLAVAGVLAVVGALILIVRARRTRVGEGSSP